MVGGLIVAAILAVFSYLYGKHRTTLRFKKMHEAAISNYASELRKLIEEASLRSKDLKVEARSIVLVRNNLRNTLTSLAILLNSEIDRLERLIRDGDQIDEDEVRESLKVLKRSWPVKSVQIEVEIRKMLAELGLEPQDK